VVVNDPQTLLGFDEIIANSIEEMLSPEVDNPLPK